MNFSKVCVRFVADEDCRLPELDKIQTSEGHTLTPEQKQEAAKYSNTIVDFKDDEPSLLRKLYLSLLSL
ncbi:MAG: hypothetical protein H7A23_07775 [Leptospiraceae bacterium]|nr:hypothetical protein [Leptospiraceae bacterium]MCP5494441.1 hypothetical protein [Leptospiraceae bacterium]